MENEIEVLVESSANHSTPPINVEKLKDTMIKKLLKQSPLSAKCCIFRVPKVLRRHNPKAYRPDVVSIGPFHDRRGKRFQLMEKVKQWYLNHVLSVLLNMDLQTLIDQIDNIIEFEKRAREFYADPPDDLSPNELIEMMIVDGCFLLQLFRRFYVWTDIEGEDFSKDDPILNIINDPMLNMACMRQYLFHDLLLLENQLPWFVLEHLYSLAVSKGKYPLEPSLNVLVLKFFIPISEMSLYFNFYIDHLNLKNNDAIGQQKILHMLDLARSAIVFQPVPKLKLPPATNCLSKAWVKFRNSIGFPIRKQDNVDPDSSGLSCIILPPATKCLLKAWFKFRNSIGFPIRKHDDVDLYSSGFSSITLPPATSLSEAGVKFSKSSGNGIFNIKFENGVFELPGLEIAELTEPLLRNLVSFEQCYHGCDQQIITSYVLLMDRLINTSKDMDLLCEKKIISNWLSSETASLLFNNLYDDTLITPYKPYRKLCHQVNTYYNTRWHRWLEKFWRDYFGNPWTIISLIAAIILLLLTILQTAYTILAYYFPR